jgi:hypothetical protein
MLRGSGCDQGDVGETAQSVSSHPKHARTMNSPVAAAEVPEAQGLLGRKVHHNEAIGTCLLCILQHLLFAVAQQRVVVSHEHDRRLEAPLPRISNILENSRDVYAVLKGLL